MRMLEMGTKQSANQNNMIFASDIWGLVMLEL